MHVEAVIDASVLAAAFFNENHSDQARSWLAEGRPLAAPELLRIEIASVAAKKVWLGEIRPDVGEMAIIKTDEMVSRFAASGHLALAAFRLARAHRFSAYDAVYLALAQTLDVRVVTLDVKLARRAGEVGLADIVRLLV